MFALLQTLIKPTITDQEESHLRGYVCQLVVIAQSHYHNTLTVNRQIGGDTEIGGDTGHL